MKWLYNWEYDEDTETFKKKEVRLDLIIPIIALAIFAILAFFG